MKNDKIICIFGGSGFLGKNITQDLARKGYRIKIATRIPESAYELKSYGTIGQITPVACNYNEEASIQNAVKGCYAVINLVGILYEKGKSKFKKAHIEVPETIAKCCASENVHRFIHISALGIENSSSKYAKSKLQGEEAIKAHFPDVTILRPSVVFGPGDSFFNMFAKLSVFLPALPLIGGGKTKFQPVYVGDIAEAVTNIIEDKNGDFSGKTYHLGGPEVVSFKEIYEILFAETRRSCALVSIPWPLAKIQGAFMGLLPKPPLTLDQVKSLKFDNIVKGNVLTLEDLGVNPTAMKTILPRYLACYKKGGRFSDKKAA